MLHGAGEKKESRKQYRAKGSESEVGASVLEAVPSQSGNI